MNRVKEFWGGHIPARNTQDIVSLDQTFNMIENDKYNLLLQNSVSISLVASKQTSTVFLEDDFNKGEKNEKKTFA